MKHKFNAKKVEFDGIIFPSKLEGNYYLWLQKQVSVGKLVFFLRQTPFHLPGNTVYRVDFQEFWADGNVVFTDTKGMMTKDFIKNKKLVEDLFPVSINVIGKEFYKDGNYAK
jgi:hypothetical protein